MDVNKNLGTKAVVVGASGATGRALVARLLQTESVSEVVVLSRRTVFEAHPKLNEVVIDFNRLSDYAELIRGDVAFSTLGTTLKQAGGKKAQWKVDVTYNLEFAQLARKNGVKSFVLLSALGASSKSTIFYSKMKGVLEDEVKKMDFEKLIVVRPSLLIRPKTDRFGEVIYEKVLNAFNRVGLLVKYQPLPVDKVAVAMLKSIYIFGKKEQLMVVKDILELSR